MGYANRNTGPDRVKSLIVVIAIHGLLGYALVSSIGVDVARSVGDSLKVITVSPPPPQPKNEPANTENKDQEDEGAASAANLKAKPTEVVAPKPKVNLKVKSPIIAAPKSSDGNQASAGASDRPGPGTGRDGNGNGLGSGQGGDGTGGGGIASPPKHRSGSLTRKDIPRDVWREKGRGNVRVDFTVEANGRVSGCWVKRSSGYPSLDEATCRLIEKRFRFEPARDYRGNPVAQPYGWLQEWWLGRPRN